METGSGARLARLLLETFELMVGEVTAELTSSGHPGLTAANEFALQAIDRGATNASTLARSLDVSRQAAAKTIQILESLGYVIRRSNESDARRIDVELTDQARRALIIGSRSFDTIRDRWVDDVGPRRVSTVEKALTALHHDLRTKYRPDDTP